MMLDKLTDEAGRLASLLRYDVLDTPPEAPYDKITQLVKTVLNVPIAAVSLIDADRQWFKSCVGVEVRETARDISFCTHTIKSAQPMVINDARSDPKFAHNPLVLGAPFIASYAGAPLITPDGYAIGSLCAIDTVPRDFPSWQVDVLKSFAALVVDEFELRRRAHADSVTGALSRRAFLAEADRAISHFARHNLPSSLLVFDIDEFKQYNEAYGRAAGDAVLRDAATLISKQSRPGDVLARLGGDEFGLLLTATDLDHAMLAAERCRASLAGLTFEHDPKLRITASFGIAAIEPSYVTPEKWLAAATLALVEAKRTGKNKSCAHTEALAEADDDDVYILRRDTEQVDAAAGAGDCPAENDEQDEDLERHKSSIEPLSRPLWAKLRRLRRVREAATGRLAYGGLDPGIVNCRILRLGETGIQVETNAKLSPVPEFFSVEFCGIYCRAKTCNAEDYEIELEFIFDGA